MKELSIEEKAYDGNYKAYTELINRLEDVKDAIKKQNYGIAMDILCKPYPEFQIIASTELKESEDERIRKELIAMVKLSCTDGDDVDKKIAWLEKQGQKPANKVEPKFRVGDWIVSDEHPNCGNSLMKIVEVGLTDYLCGYYNGQTTYCHEFIDKSYHLWTIQDAKDGDVLSDGTTIFMFKDLLSDGSVISHCDYDTDTGESDAFCPSSVNLICSKITPATKEQRDTLIKAMADAGYTFDFDKKELKKIEQKPAEWTQDNVKELTDFEIAMMHIGDSFFGQYAGLDPNDTNAIKEQATILLGLVPKQEWSEENKRIIDNLISQLGNLFARKLIKEETKDKYVNWLKSLKERYTWKPSDEQINALAKNVEYVNVGCTQHILKELLEDLKKLKE